MPVNVSATSWLSNHSILISIDTTQMSGTSVLTISAEIFISKIRIVEMNEYHLIEILIYYYLLTISILGNVVMGRKLCPAGLKLTQLFLD